MSTSDPITTKGDANLLPPAEIGDNSQAEAEAFNAAMRQMISLNGERAALNAKITKARKGFKADGIALKPLDATIAMLEWEPSEVREHFAVQERYARYAKLPIGTQLDLMAHASEDEVVQGDWKSRGYGAAVTGKGTPGVPPPECPPEHHQDWLSGWNDGQWDNAPKKLRVAE